MLKRISIFTALISLLSLTSCNTEFSLNGDYEVSPLVFGLLDQNDSVHLIKITKTFLGDGNNYDYAKIADSSYYASVDAQVIELNNGDETGRSWQLKDTLIGNKQAGTFYAPEQKVYVFYANDLNEEFEYKLVADLNEGKYKIDATTTLVDGFKHQSNLSSGNYKFTFGTQNSTLNDDYSNFISTYTEADHAARYSYQINVKFRETYNDATTADFSIPWKKADEYQDKPESPGSATMNFSGREFYILLQDNIDVDANIAKREILGLDLIVGIAHTNLAKYMEISEPSSSITQATPEFTNVNCDNATALGIFSARNVVILENIQLTPGSIEELCKGQFTAALSFCSSEPSHIVANKTFVCE
jgi:hypothetical protein